MAGRLQTLRSFDQIKILADGRRLEILRLLMEAPATLTQLAVRMRHSPAWIRHHMQSLVSAGLAERAGVRLSGRTIEKYYRARAGALLLEELILPRSRTPVVVFSGSHDLALEGLVDCLMARQVILPLYVGSLNGLMYLRQGLCQISGSHLLDESGEYNAPYVRHIFADREIDLVTLVHRTQGLMLAPGNPKAVQSLQDLARPRLRFVNRNRGSGTRLWLDRELQRMALSTESVRGWRHEVATHSEAAALIQAGRADVAVGLEAAARQAGLDFLPLFEERYDLVLPRQSERVLGPVLDCIQTRAFRDIVASMAGYNTAHSGEQIPI